MSIILTDMFLLTSVISDDLNSLKPHYETTLKSRIIIIIIFYVEINVLGY